MDKAQLQSLWLLQLKESLHHQHSSHSKLTNYGKGCDSEFGGTCSYGDEIIALGQAENLIPKRNKEDQRIKVLRLLLFHCA